MPIASPRFSRSAQLGISWGARARRSSTTILPGAVFGPILTTENLGSVQIIQGLLQGRPPALPRLGFWIVDVRDLADLHIRAMTAARRRDSASSRPATSCGWRRSRRLCARLGDAGAKAPTRRLPDFVVRLLLPFMANLRSLAPLLGRSFALTTDKARRMLASRLGPRPRLWSTARAACWTHNRSIQLHQEKRMTIKRIQVGPRMSQAVIHGNVCIWPARFVPRTRARPPSRHKPR